MAQFDVYSLPGTNMLFIDVQSGAVDEYNTRLLAPMIAPEPNLKPLRRVNRELRFQSRIYLFMPQLMSAVRTKGLGASVGSVADQRDRITSALDVLFLGI